MSPRKLGLGLAFPLALFACSSPPASENVAQQSAAALTTIETGFLKARTGLCLDVYANQQSTGAAVNIATCNGTTAQTFTFTEGGPGPIKNTHSGLCLDDVWGGGAVLQMVTCMGTPEQEWTVSRPYAGTMQLGMLLVDGYSHCVDVLGNTQKNGQTVNPTTCNGTTAQAWTFEACGGNGETACGGSTCNTGPVNMVVRNGVCVACGADAQQAGSAVGEPACGNGLCNEGANNVNGTCVACGGAGQPACNECGEANGPSCPLDNGGCVSQTTNVNGTCEGCSGNGQTVCPGGSCDYPYGLVGAECEACGGNDQIPCNSGCASGLVDAVGPTGTLCVSACGNAGEYPCSSGGCTGGCYDLGGPGNPAGPCTAQNAGKPGNTVNLTGNDLVVTSGICQLNPSCGRTGLGCCNAGSWFQGGDCYDDTPCSYSGAPGLGSWQCQGNSQGSGGTSTGGGSGTGGCGEEGEPVCSGGTCDEGNGQLCNAGGYCAPPDCGLCASDDPDDCCVQFCGDARVRLPAKARAPMSTHPLRGLDGRTGR